MIRMRNAARQNSLLLGFCGLGFAVAACKQAPPVIVASDPTQTLTVMVGDARRSFTLHTPPKLDPTTPAPLVLVFHGSGGTGAGTQKLTHFNDVSDVHGFLVAYPDGIDKHWNIGADAKAGADDLAFVSTMLEQIAQKHPVDPNRIYACGMSNGGFFTFRLACEMSDRFAAIATVGAGILAESARTCKPTKAIPLAMFNGDADPLIPYAGGKVRATRFRAEDNILSAEASIRFWAELNACQSDFESSDFPVVDEKDDTRVSRIRVGVGRENAVVELFTIHGGGHTWPGGYQYLGERLIGKTTRQIDASEEIWKFFSGFPSRSR